MGTTLYSLNQNRLSLASGDINANGRKYVGVQSMTPSEEVKDEPVYGSGQVAIGKTRGQLTSSFSFEILIGEGDALFQDLGTPLSSAPFDISGTFIEVGSTEPSYTLSLTQITIKKIEITMGNDGKPFAYKLDCTVIQPISWNGVYLVDLPAGSDPSLFGFVVSLF